MILQLWNDNGQGKNCPSTRSFITSPTWPTLGLNLGLSSRELATTCLSCGTAWHINLVTTHIQYCVIFVICKYAV
jgi:hypothetical protein